MRGLFWAQRAQVLLPALRCDMAQLPLPADVAVPPPHSPSHVAAFGMRPYLLCCVRLSPEKEPLRFVELVEELQASGHLARLQVEPPSPPPAASVSILPGGEVDGEKAERKRPRRKWGEIGGRHSRPCPLQQLRSKLRETATMTHSLKRLFFTFFICNSKLVDCLVWCFFSLSLSISLVAMTVLLMPLLPPSPGHVPPGDDAARWCEGLSLSTFVLQG